MTLADLQQYCRKLGLKATDVLGMLEEADKDGDGRISQDEFITTMRNTNLFRQFGSDGDVNTNLFRQT